MGLKRFNSVQKVSCLKQNQKWEWAIPENIHTPPMDDIGDPVVNAR